ncbi:MAG: DNA repair protein RecN [Bacteroidetes bacterium]|nr:MAG: DNA repair protein RecN [Bacteroidota bacterium]
MLDRLYIKNYAIIDHQEIEFSEGLNIITGETGAGKSIMLGALALVLGARAESKILFDSSKKAIVEAQFGDYPKALDQLLVQQDVDISDEVIMRREILPSGKSRAFINDTPVRLDFMRMISSKLIDLHQQFESLEIQESAMQFEILDGFSELGSRTHAYKALYSKHQALTAKVVRLESDQAKAIQEKDYIEFQLNELITALPEEGQIEKWEEDYALQDNAEQIQASLFGGINAILESDSSIIDAIRQIVVSLADIAESSKNLGTIVKRLESVTYELEDISGEMSNIASEVEPNPALKQELEEKIDAVRRLMLKHNVRSGEELNVLALGLQDKLDNWVALNSDLEKAISEKEHTRTELTKLASKISKIRSKNAIPFAKEANEMLIDLEMKNARFEIQVTATKHLNALGTDSVEFLFSSNLGSELQPVGKVASGGELSRLSLCIKSVVCQKMKLPTMIFDEIDTGVSGQVALKMGQLLKFLATNQQVIMITHSPQIAAHGNWHLRVSKRDLTERSIAEIILLKESERVYEIAKMLSGDPPTEAAVMNAQELINT